MDRKWALILISLFVTVSVIIGAIFALFLFAKQENQPAPIAQIEEIDAPTSTPVLRATFVPTQTNTPILTEAELKDFRIGGYAQISGTSGDGLSIRSGPATTYKVNFVGLDSELFKIVDGPIDADGYIWWKVEAPYDTNRNGWCVQNYLNVVTAPEE